MTTPQAAPPISWKQVIIGGFTLLASVAAVYGIGYSLGKDSNDSLVNLLREKNQALESTEKILRAEVEATKLELKGLQAGSAQPIETTTPATNTKPASPSSSSPSITASSPSKSAATQVVSVGRGETAQVFGGELLITVRGLRFETQPAVSHYVIGSIGAKGQPNKDFGENGAAAGTVFLYQEFEVRILKTDTFNAEFLVSRIQPKT